VYELAGSVSVRHHSPQLIRRKHRCVIRASVCNSFWSSCSQPQPWTAPTSYPFLFPLGMGTDICEVQRIRRVLSDKNQAKVEKFGRKIFSENEMPGFLDRAKTVQDLEHLSSGEDEAATSYCKYQRELSKFSEWTAGRYVSKRYYGGRACVETDILTTASPQKRLPSKPCILSRSAGTMQKSSSSKM
jgi:hypothetical protein